jgi:hypothetical protein
MWSFRARRGPGTGRGSRDLPHSRHPVHSAGWVACAAAAHAGRWRYNAPETPSPWQARSAVRLATSRPGFCGHQAPPPFASEGGCLPELKTSSQRPWAHLSGRSLLQLPTAGWHAARCARFERRKFFQPAKSARPQHAGTVHALVSCRTAQSHRSRASAMDAVRRKRCQKVAPCRRRIGARRGAWGASRPLGFDQRLDRTGPNRFRLPPEYGMMGVHGHQPSSGPLRFSGGAWPPGPQPPPPVRAFGMSAVGAAPA